MYLLLIPTNKCPSAEEQGEMISPCLFNGTMKYVHREWCYQKNHRFNSVTNVYTLKAIKT